MVKPSLFFRCCSGITQDIGMAQDQTVPKPNVRCSAGLL